MKKLTASALAVVLLIAMTGCGKDKKTAAPDTEATAVNVTAFEAEEQTIENNVTYTGEIKASEFTSVSAKVSGQAKVVYCEVGDYVNAGDVLLQIDDTDYRTQYNQAVAARNQAQAAYAQANASYEGAVASYNSVINGSAQQTKLQLQSALDAAKIEFDNAKINYENQKVLYESGAVSKSVYDAAVTRYENAQLNYNTAKSNYDLTVDVILEESKTNAQSGVNSAEAGKNSAQAALNSANVAVDAAQNSLSNTIVRAPISGYIASRNANKGQMVSPGAELFSIKATDSVEAQINVTESIIPSVTVGTKAAVAVKSAGAEIEGTVTTVSPTKNAQTGMYQVSIAIDNSDGTLKDGMFADITLTLSDSVDALVVPSESILEDEDGTKYIYTANKNTAKRVDVEIGIITDEYTEIVSGIEKGDKVIVSGKEYLSDKNNKIKIVE